MDIKYRELLSNSQINLANRVCNNIADDKRIQTIFMPNGGGKTLLSLVISANYTLRQKRVLLYTNSEVDKYQLRRTLGSFYNDKAFEKICYANPENTMAFVDKSFDIVITDSMRSQFDSLTLSNFENLIRDFDPEVLNNSSHEPSSAQKSMCALHYLQKMIERDNPYVVSFELSGLEDINYIPLLAYPRTADEDVEENEIILSGNNEYEELLKMKKQAIISDAKKTEVDSINGYMYLVLNSMSERVKRIETEFTRLKDDMAFVASTVALMNNKVIEGKDPMFLSDPSQNDEIAISKIISNMMDALTPDITKLQQQMKYQQIQELVKVKLGKEWDKLSDDSKKFLVTAKFLFAENMSLGDCMDYSSVCLLASKAFEVELAKRFLIEYQKYLVEMGFAEKTWPRGIMMFDKGSESYRKMKIDEFTLGSCPYIFGFYGKADDKKENRKYFEKYCKEKLLASKEEQHEVQSHLKEYDKYIKFVKNKYRNPAAHKNMMDINSASACIDYILEVERVLKKMLETFAY